jgi:PAS domain S-box-containing protein
VRRLARGVAPTGALRTGVPMADHKQNEDMLKRQQVLADFGEFALESENLDEVLAEACRLVADVLGTGRSKILEIQNAGECLFVRAGVGWDPDVVGHLHLPMSEHSSETFAIQEGRPVITQDIGKEERFQVPEFMRKAGVVALANAPIFLPGRKPYGLLQVDATEPRDFSDADTEFLRTYTIILGPVIDRLHKVQDLRTSEGRFRLVVERALDYAIFLTDAQDRITDWLPGAEAVYGWTAEEAIGQPASILFTSEDRGAGVPEQEVEAARRDGTAPNVRWHVRKDGTRIFIEGSVTSVNDERTSARCFLKIGQNVTERRETEEALRESEARFRQFAGAASAVVWIRNAETLRFEYVGPAFERIYGVRSGYVREGGGIRGWLKLILPQDRARALEAFRTARAGEPITYEFRIRRPIDGEERWVENTSFPLFDAAGRVQRVGGIGADITELKCGQHRQEVLINELQHRSRNLLGVITSVANRTLGAGGSVPDFETRLKALSRAQGLLSESGSDTVEVGALVHMELAAHVEIIPPKVVVAGPKAHLTARQMQNFTLALHELTTNAVKYGALKDGVGRLSVTWVVTRDKRDRLRLLLNWVESGVPIQPDQVTRRGYGRELIENALAYALRAETEYVLGEDGVRCRIELPLT